MIKIVKRVKENILRNKLSFAFSMWEDNKYYCRLFLWLFCGPGVLSFWFPSGKCLCWQYSLKEYKWDEQRAEQKLFLWNTRKIRRLAFSSVIYSICWTSASYTYTHSKWRIFHQTIFLCFPPTFSFGKIYLFSCYLKMEKVSKKTSSNGMLVLNGLRFLKKWWDELLNLRIWAAFWSAI